jgi:GTP-binding protein Era
MPRAGILTVVGRPNAGKSTLLNRIVGEKLSIVSEKPQSTRDRIVGIRSTDDTQIIILDTPGLLNPRYALQKAMRGAALAALADADVVLHLVDATEGTPESLVELAQVDKPTTAPVVLTFNKTDQLPKGRRAAMQEEYPDASFISAATGAGVDKLLTRLGEMLPTSEFLYPADDISTQTMRFFVAELIRETALEQLEDEVPYSVACEIEEFRESDSPVYIRAVLHVERESQKRILIGAGGQKIRSIGQAARAKVEKLVGAAVYLDLWVKVLPNWRRNVNALNRLGYKLPEEQAP